MLRAAKMEGGVVGRLLAGRYRVGALIGSGAMSVVHEAEDLRLSRRVALKFVKHEQSAELTERLFREAKAAARTNHPAVVTVFGYGTDLDTGLDYLVMERLDGEDLAARLSRERRLPNDMVVRLGSELADALAHMHDTGVVHRDLKPANVYLARRGLRSDEVKLLDFGVAKQLDLQTLTVTGQVVGTIAYMAPEQIVDARCADPRSDIYALGVMLYECLCGQLPYSESSIAELARRILTGDPPEMDALHAHAPPALVNTVSRCIRRTPVERFASARELCNALLAVSRTI